MHIQIRKKMDDKLRLERNSLKIALDAAHVSEREKAVACAIKEKERDMKAAEKHLHDEINKLQANVTELKRGVAEKEQQMIRAVNVARNEGDQKVCCILK